MARGAAAVRTALRAMGSHGGFLSRGGAGRLEFEQLGERPSEAAGFSLPSTDSVLRTDSPSKVIKLDTVRVIAEKVSRVLLWVPFQGGEPRRRPPVLAPRCTAGTPTAPLGRSCDVGAWEGHGGHPWAITAPV